MNDASRITLLIGVAVWPRGCGSLTFQRVTPYISSNDTVIIDWEAMSGMLGVSNDTLGTSSELSNIANLLGVKHTVLFGGPQLFAKLPTFLQSQIILAVPSAESLQSFVFDAAQRQLEAFREGTGKIDSVTITDWFDQSLKSLMSIQADNLTSSRYLEYELRECLVTEILQELNSAEVSNA